MSIPFYIVSLVFIGLDNMPVIFGFLSYGICDNCVKNGCHVNILLTVCAWLHRNGVNIDCSKIKRVFLGDRWNIFGSFFLSIDANVLYASIVGLFMRLVLESCDLVYWC